MRPGQEPGQRQRRTVEELARLLEDALSAAAGWTVPPPEIYPVESTLGGPNWAVDVHQLDDRMLAAVRNLQNRYDLTTRTRRRSAWRLFWDVARPWGHSRRLCI